MSGKDGLGDQGDVIIKPFACEGEKIIEHRAHGQHGGAGIDGACGRGHGAGLAADSRCRINQRDGMAGGGEPYGCGKAAEPGPDNNCARLCRHKGMMRADGALSSKNYRDV